MSPHTSSHAPAGGQYHVAAALAAGVGSYSSAPSDHTAMDGSGGASGAAPQERQFHVSASGTVSTFAGSAADGDVADATAGGGFTGGLAGNGPLMGRVASSVAGVGADRRVTLHFSIPYHTQWGQSLLLCGSGGSRPLLACLRSTPKGHAAPRCTPHPPPPRRPPLPSPPPPHLCHRHRLAAHWILCMHAHRAGPQFLQGMWKSAARARVPPGSTLSPLRMHACVPLPPRCTPRQHGVVKGQGHGLPPRQGARRH